MRNRRLWVVVCVAGVCVLAAGLAWFQPWKLWVDQRVDDTLPAVALAPAPTLALHTPAPHIGSGTGTASGASTTAPAPSVPTSSAANGPRLLSRGELISHEHPTHGTVSVVQQPDGRRILAIAHLDTSNGPDLHVWLTDAPVRPGSDGWHVFDDGTHVSLGTLKGNVGNQVYSIPSSVDLRKLTSVTIWCSRFEVSFGAAQLSAAAG